MINETEVKRGRDTIDFECCGEGCIPQHSTPSQAPSVSLSPTISARPATRSPTPTMSASPVKQCEVESDIYDLITIEITLGETPLDSYWDLRDQGSGKIIVGVLYDVEEQPSVRKICKPVSDCYLFRLVGTNKTSASIALNGEKPKKAKAGDIIQIGNTKGCQNGK